MILSDTNLPVFPNIKYPTTGASDSIHRVGATTSETPGHCELLVGACDGALGIQEGTEQDELACGCVPALGKVEEA